MLDWIVGCQTRARLYLIYYQIFNNKKMAFLILFRVAKSPPPSTYGQHSVFDSFTEPVISSLIASRLK